MPADHINISHPDRFDLFSSQYASSLKIKQLEMELQHLRGWHESLSNNLTAIFTRIERGQTAELHYPDGHVIVIAGEPKVQHTKGM